ncbi:Protein of unknown function [Gryllus bimaculatus]|nr:Protein of unknown function [Gryllus bimaculatus]
MITGTLGTLPLAIRAAGVLGMKAPGWSGSTQGTKGRIMDLAISSSVKQAPMWVTRDKAGASRSHFARATGSSAVFGSQPAASARLLARAIGSWITAQGQKALPLSRALRQSLSVIKMLSKDSCIDFGLENVELKAYAVIKTCTVATPQLRIPYSPGSRKMPSCDVRPKTMGTRCAAPLASSASGSSGRNGSLAAAGSTHGTKVASTPRRRSSLVLAASTAATSASAGAARSHLSSADALSLVRQMFAQDPEFDPSVIRTCKCYLWRTDNKPEGLFRKESRIPKSEP